MQEQRPTRRTCGAHAEHRRLLNEDPSYAAAQTQIENLAWAYRTGAEASARVGTTRIPAVVHVVWNTQAQNISDAQIRSQIAVLNQDFRMTNPDIGQVPQVWQSVTGDARVEFFLATTAPNGTPTTGITRTQTQRTSFSQPQNDIKSAATGGVDPWPADRYLNVWVGPDIRNIQGDPLLGYAQFPGGPAATDGIVILHSAFGTTGTAAAPFDRGRTATHEIGHWLNLRHIGGDDGTGCNGTDLVDDTPNQADQNFGCPAFPNTSCNNGPNGDMFMNYMDYTDDACMFMFTAGQVTRMQAALDGPRITIGSLFPAPQRVFNTFSYSDGWRVERHPRFLADLTGDGRADIVGFGTNDVFVSLNNGNGTFQAPQRVFNTFSYSDGWRVERHPRFLTDLTGDGRADIVGFGTNDVFVSLNTPQ